MMIDDFYQLYSDTRQPRINDRSAYEHRLPDQKLSLQPNEVIYQRRPVNTVVTESTSHCLITAY